MKIAVFGAKGRVGSSVVAILRKRGFETIEVEAETAAHEIICDGVVDFSNPNAVQNVCLVCKNNNVPLVCGTTGYDEGQMALIEQLSGVVPVVYRQNFSKGVAVLTEILALARKKLPDFDVELVEIHRKGKIDSPSGTAMMLASQLTDCDTKTGNKHAKTALHSLRMGSVFGVHTVIFAGIGETLTISHNAENVEVFALGAVDELLKLLKKPLI